MWNKVCCFFSVLLILAMTLHILKNLIAVTCHPSVWLLFVVWLWFVSALLLLLFAHKAKKYQSHAYAYWWTRSRCFSCLILFQTSALWGAARGTRDSDATQHARWYFRLRHSHVPALLTSSVPCRLMKNRLRSLWFPLFIFICSLAAAASCWQKMNWNWEKTIKILMF